jgi:signal transduction histidine kinase
VRISRLAASTGVRLAVLQAVLLIVLFSVAGSLTKFSVKVIYRREVQTRILGEAGALTALDRDKGLTAVAKAVAQSARRPDGLEYRLEASDGTALSNDLPRTGAGLGWAFLDWDDAHVPGRPYQDLMAYTQRLPDNATLTIAQDLSEESKIRHALKRVLFWCEVFGVGIGLIISVLLGWGTLRRVQGIVGAARAVSGAQMQVRAPARRALIPDDIDELGATFNSMLDALDTLVGRLRWVSADAHDLRTPLTHVKQKLELIKAADETSPETSAACQAIDRDIDELLRTLDAMLRLAEIENDRHAARVEPVDLAELASRVIDAYRPDLEASGRHLTVRLVPASFDGDADLVAQAIGNLIENALRHTPPGASIVVAVDQTADRAVFSVTDNGPGIPADEREAVLQRFHRLQSSRTTRGSGLGLPIVAAIAKRHGGTLELSDAGPGLRVELAFPATVG